MKKTTEMIAAAAMFACMVTPVHADNEGTVTITHTVNTSYVITIPASFTIADHSVYTVKIGENPVIPYGSIIKVSIEKSENGTADKPFQMKNDKNQMISYQIRKGDQTIGKNGVVLEQKAGRSAEVSADLTIVPSQAEYSGTYTDTVTFKVSVVE
ncbi:MAG: hypothetical protein ACI32N_09305 [Bulleidia sp.]